MEVPRLAALGVMVSNVGTAQLAPSGKIGQGGKGSQAGATGQPEPRTVSVKAKALVVKVFLKAGRPANTRHSTNNQHVGFALLLLLLGFSWGLQVHSDDGNQHTQNKREKDSVSLLNSLENTNIPQKSRREARYDEGNIRYDSASADSKEILEKIKTASSTRLLSSPKLGAKFSRGYIDLGSRDPVEEGAATLAFVFDTTGSMSDDLRQVIDGAGKILNTVLEKFERPIHNYVFVPFHDPEVGPMTVTADPQEFQESLKKSFIFGGGDCPEMAVRAIKMALEVSLPSSYVYVFTDARAKDFYLLDDVLRLIQKKQSQVVFVMTGDCGNHTHPGYQAFETIASTSSGQIFHLDKSDVKEVLNFVRLSLESRKVNLLSIDRESEGPGEENLPLLVDRTLKHFTISVSGEKPKIQIYGPEGEDVSQNTGVENLLALENVKIVGVKEPPPGGSSYVVVKPADITEFGDIYRLQMVSLKGDILEDLPLYRLPGPQPVYNGTSFLAPNEPFNIKIFGRDEHGYEFERFSPTAISSQLPFAPEVVSAERAHGYFDEPAIISCHVKTLVPFTLSWQKGGVELSPSQTYPQSAEVAHVVESPTREDEGRYTCVATNIAGSASSSIFLDMKEPPPQIAAPVNTSVIPTQAAVLSCEVSSTVEYNLTWYRYVVQGQVQDFFGRTETIGEFVSVEGLEGYRVLSNNSLLLEDVSLRDEGWFRCTAANEGGRISREVHVSVLAPPEVSIVPDVVLYQTRDNITVSCTGRGFPEPTISWWRGNTQLTGTKGRISVSDDHKLNLFLANPEDGGPYTCSASSSAGTVRATVMLNFITAPQVTAVQEQVLVGSGDTVVLQCQVRGTPPLTVRWLKNDAVEVTPMSFIQVEGDHLKILGVQENDAGWYTCIATNLAGTAQAHISLSVGSPPTVIHAPADTVVEIGSSGELSCYGVGVPEPYITWRRSDGLPFSTRFTKDADGNLGVTGMVMEADGSLNISRVLQHDEGDYQCVATNVAGNSSFTLHLSVQVPPRAKTNRLDEKVVALEGDQMKLKCPVRASPPLTFIWHKDGQRILGGSHRMRLKKNGTLAIKSLVTEDAGTYVCTAVNAVGATKIPVVLEVHVPPTIREDSEMYSVSEREVLVVPCVTTGIPPPTLTWIRDDQTLMWNNTLRDGSLGEGRYECLVTNAAGSAKRAVNVMLIRRPEISPPGDETLTVLTGQDLKLPCEVTGHPPPSVIWRRDGENVDAPLVEEELQLWPERSVVEGGQLSLPCNANAYPEPTRDWTKDGAKLLPGNDLTISSEGAVEVSRAAPTHSGSYRCTLVNKIGEAYIDYDVKVLIPPKVASQHRSETPVVVEGDGDGLSIFSTKDRADMTHIIVEDNGQTLHILEATVDDKGVYQCIAKNDAGETELLFPLEVLVAPQFTQFFHIPDLRLKVGEELSLNCDVLWQHNGEPLYVHVMPGGQQVHIPRVKVRDAGLYTCYAVNSAGTTHRNFSAPVLEDGVGQNTVAEVMGKDSQLRSGVEYSTAEDRQVLVLHRVSSTSSGVYICNATNSVGSAVREFNFTVMTPPSVRHRSGDGDNDDVEDIKVVAGRDIIMYCWVDGSPLPTITWWRGGQSLTLSPRFHLTAPDQLLITNTQDVDSGDYSCLATNRAGTAEKQFDVQVIVPAEIKDSSEAGEKSENRPYQEVLVDMPISLYCPAVGSPLPYITWTKDDTPLVGLLGTGLDGRLNLGEDGRRLLLSGAVISDSGTYTCTAENEGGRDSVSYDVVVLVPPMIIQETDTFYSTVEGEELDLQCEAEGDPAPAIVWLQDGVVLEDLELPGVIIEDAITVMADNVTKSNSTVRIVSVSEIHAGSYTCIASSMAGSDELSYVVRVATVPRLEDDLTSTHLTARVNRPATLVCQVQSTPDPQIFWFKNSNPLEDDAPNVHLSVDGRDIKFLQVTESDAGNYSCLAVNDAGAIFLNFTLEVHVPPRLVEEVDDVQYVVAGADVEFYCPVHATPTPSILWMKDTSIMQQTFTALDPRTLLLKNVNKTDDGRYVCLATNEAGTVEQDFTLRVMVPPRLSDLDSPMVEKSVVDGKSLSSLSSEVTVDNRGRHLTISYAQPSDSGNYTCQATNVAGTTNLTTLLSVLTPPSWNSDSDLEEEIVGVAGHGLDLYCDVLSSPAPSILWVKDGQMLTPTPEKVLLTQNDKLLQLKSLKDSDSGHYTCVANNAAGTAEYDFEVTVLAPPTLLYQPQTDHTVLVNRAVSLECPVEGTPQPDIEWIVDDQPVTDSSRFISLSSTKTQLNLFRYDLITFSSTLDLYSCFFTMK
ncbi:Hemicentin-1-like 7 [Homarus americanus]|uniref:Hemicentin-1-like 7 n=1 Tax=Homarus americanus TaxID=6706 RepID=A0A8J5MTQ3_HOMAM|nr:Hemicentin-1-like 7 [Homarus americanus]